MREFIFIVIVVICCMGNITKAADDAPMFPDSGNWGVVVHNPYHGKALQGEGVQWVRLSMRWKAIEKGEKGNYEWEEADKLIKYYIDNGFRVIAILTAENLCPLYKDDENNKDTVINAIARWAGAVAARYKGKGIVWEIGNEPEVFPMGDYWKHPLTYTKMARAVAVKIKQADSNAHIAALSVAWFDRNFISSALDAGLLADGTIDILSFHGYHRPTIMPESGLVEDVGWLRKQIKQYAPAGKKVIAIDSERGYAIKPFLQKKAWHSWRNQVYSEQEQAAYLARHYLEEIYLGLEISVWYKDMRGESGFSLWYGTETDKRGLRPMGYVYRNLSHLLSDNPKKMINNIYAVSLVDLPDKISAPDSKLELRTYLRTYLRDNGSNGKKLIIAIWNPVEAFDGRILDSRKRIGDNYYEAWRAISPVDEVEIPVKVSITGPGIDKVVNMSSFDITAKDSSKLSEPLKLEKSENSVVSPVIKIGPMPTILVCDVKE